MLADRRGTECTCTGMLQQLSVSVCPLRASQHGLPMSAAGTGGVPSSTLSQAAVRPRCRSLMADMHRATLSNLRKTISVQNVQCESVCFHSPAFSSTDPARSSTLSFTIMMTDTVPFTMNIHRLRHSDSSFTLHVVHHTYRRSSGVLDESCTFGCLVSMCDQTCLNNYSPCCICQPPCCR
jgi:hypothetical protein